MCCFCHGGLFFQNKTKKNKKIERFVLIALYMIIILAIHILTIVMYIVTALQIAAPHMCRIISYRHRGLLVKVLLQLIIPPMITAQMYPRQQVFMRVCVCVCVCVCVFFFHILVSLLTKKSLVVESCVFFFFFFFYFLWCEYLQPTTTLFLCKQCQYMHQ